MVVLSKDVKQSKSEINFINKELKQSKSKVTCLSEDQQQSRNEVNCLREELKQSKNEVSCLSDNLKQSLNAFSNIENMCNDLQATVNSLKEKANSNLTSQQNVMLEKDLLMPQLGEYSFMQ